MSWIECAHCSDFDHFEAAIREPVGRSHAAFIEVYGKHWKWPRRIKPKKLGQHHIDLEAQKQITKESRGTYQLITLCDSDFTRRWKGFKIEILGMAYGLNLPLPPGPLFHVDDHIVSNYKTGCTLFNACRITKDASDMDIRIHWWPDREELKAALLPSGNDGLVRGLKRHGRVITIKGFPLGRASVEDFEILEQALTLFRFLEARGRPPKITDESIRAAVRKLGNKATQSAVARELDVSDRAIRKHQGVLEWREYRSQFI
jgi:hypothetical protein